MATAEVAALYNAIRMLTEQVQTMAEQSNRGGAGGGKSWDHYDRFKNLKVFGGDVKEFEEWSVKFRSLVAAADPKVNKLMKTVESDCTEDELVKGKYNELIPEFKEEDSEFILKSSAEMYNVLLNITTGEANAVVRRSLGSGWLAWKRLTSSLNPRTLASGIKSISAALNPQRIATASKADSVLDEWEDKLVKLQTEYGQVLTNKMKVAVLYSMMPKDLQEKVLDACAVAWDGTSEADAGQLYEKVKAQIKNLAKARREMQGPKPMEVDRITNSWADWSDEWHGGWGDAEETTNDHCHDHDHEEANIQYIGKGDGKSKGKGFQGNCYICGEFGHSQWDCRKGKGKGKGFGKDGGYKGYFKGYGKDGGYKGHGKNGYKGYEGPYGKGKGDGKAGMPRACFGCGSTDHVLRDCPKNPARVQQVEEEEVLFIGNVREEWKKVPMKVKLGNYMVSKGPVKTQFGLNRFKVLEVDEEDDIDEVYVRSVEEASNETDGDGGKAPAPRMRRQVPNKAEQGNFKDGVMVKVQDHSKVERNFEDGVKVIKDQVHYVRAVSEGWLDLGKGDIIIDSAADESCWPAGQGDAFKLRESSRRMLLRTANGGDMKHYGQKDISFQYEGGKDVVGITFQVTDVKKPLLAVRRLVEKGNKVVLSANEGESYIQNLATKVKIPVKKKGGSFVIEAKFVKKAEGFARQA
jgi:hypothetical protein